MRLCGIDHPGRALRKAKESPRTPEEYEALRVAAALVGHTIVVESHSDWEGMVRVTLKGTDIYWRIEAAMTKLGVWACLEEYFWEEP